MIRQCHLCDDTLKPGEGTKLVGKTICDECYLGSKHQLGVKMPSDKDKIGCLKSVIGITRLITLTPLWLYIVYLLLKATEASEHAWSVYFTYALVCFIFCGIEVATILLLDDK